MNALVRTYLETYAGDDEIDSRREFLRLADEFSADLRYSERTWTRDDLHDCDALR